MMGWRLVISSPIRDRWSNYREVLVKEHIDDVQPPLVGMSVRIPARMLVVRRGDEHWAPHREYTDHVDCRVRSVRLDLCERVHVVDADMWHPHWARLVFGPESRKDNHRQKILDTVLERYFPEEFRYGRLLHCNLHMRCDPVLYKRLLRKTRDWFRRYLPEELSKVVEVYWGLDRLGCKDRHDPLRTRKEMRETLGVSAAVAGKRLIKAFNLFKETEGFRRLEHELTKLRLIGKNKYDYYSWYED